MTVLRTGWDCSFGIGLAQVIGEWLLDLTRFREVISPTAGDFALGFLL